jgi:hypothetical protein
VRPRHLCGSGQRKKWNLRGRAPARLILRPGLRAPSTRRTISLRSVRVAKSPSQS